MYQDWMDKIPVIEDINNCNNEPEIIKDLKR